jgi:MSHA biogenesis protein MshQ
MNLSFFHLKKIRFILAVMVAELLALSLSQGAWAAGACSAAVGSVTLNEYNYIDNFAEIKKVNSPVNLSGWTVTIYTSKRTTVKVLPASGSDTCFGDMYQVSAFASNEIGTNADMVLKDGAGDVVDILRVRTSLPVTTTYYGAKPACSFVGSSTDLLVSSGSKGADRLPDGVGAWRQTPGTGSNSFQSRCGPNFVGGNADLSVSKSVNSSTVVKGTAVTFTVRVVNNAGDTASSVLVNDLLPAGFSYVSSTVTTGSYSSSTGVWTIGDMAVNGAATLTLTANTTIVGTLSNTAAVASSTFDPTAANNTSSVSVAITSPGSTLDAVEVGAAAGTAINTKLAGQSFNLDVLALAADASIATSYNKTVTIELVDASSTATCSTMDLLQSVGTYIFTGSGVGQDNGRKTYPFSYPNAARNVRVRIKDNTTTPITACSTDNFAIRPQQLTVTAPTMGNGTLTDSPKAAAGTVFTLDAAAGVSSGYNGAPVLDTSKVQDHAITAIAAGTLSGLFSAGTGTKASGAAFKYLDVGNIKLLADAVVDSGFTSVDQSTDCVAGSTSNTLSVPGGQYGCNIGSVASATMGRWYPSHYSFVGTLTSACVTGGFTYMGNDALGVALTLKAHASSGGVPSALDPVTSRYTAGYTNLAAITISGDNSGAAVAVTRLGSPSFPIMPNTALWTAGLWVVNDSYAFAKLAAPDGPYDQFRLNVALVDPDLSVLIGVAAAQQTNTTMIRLGRLRMQNAYGSELLALPVPLEAQFWAGNFYATNTADSCTVIPMSSVTMGGYVAPLNACETQLTPVGNVALLAGRLPGTGLVLTRPGPNNGGSVALAINVGAVPDGNTCVAAAQSAATAANMPWFGPNQASRATFGIYRAPIIYRRENY